jgi:hypothetical protein
MGEGAKDTQFLGSRSRGQGLASEATWAPQGSVKAQVRGTEGEGRDWCFVTAAITSPCEWQLAQLSVQGGSAGWLGTEPIQVVWPTWGSKEPLIWEGSGGMARPLVQLCSMCGMSCFSGSYQM